MIAEALSPLKNINKLIKTKNIKKKVLLFIFLEKIKYKLNKIDANFNKTPPIINSSLKKPDNLCGTIFL